jgi:hypothetical protein
MRAVDAGGAGEGVQRRSGGEGTDSEVSKNER